MPDDKPEPRPFVAALSALKDLQRVDVPIPADIEEAGRAPSPSEESATPGQPLEAEVEPTEG